MLILLVVIPVKKCDIAQGQCGKPLIFTKTNPPLQKFYYMKNA